MKLWTAWTATCFICIGSLLFIPSQSSAGDNPDRTSLVQPVGQPAAISSQVAETAKPVPDLRSESTLSATVEKWRVALAREEGFHNWQSAAWNSYPLGPGTHGWVVILTDHGEDVGYMIVQSVENGSFRLTEYGTGKHPLFSLTTLYRSMVQQELIPATLTYSDFIANETIAKDRLYMDGLTAVWRIKVDNQLYYVDAKSGEVLPIKEDPTPKLGADDSTLMTTELKEASTVMHPAFDPYERMPWIVGSPLPMTGLSELQSALATDQHLTFVTELYDGQVTLPLAVLGYQSWQDGLPYLVLDHQGPRYIQLPTALAMGHIY
ncbi:hypothetical protein HZF08_16315 [Paenibacillus sp. CGMCC 1.16610]|uniref:PepSY domain-containing protein n=1 Tax=Paenibacillus anseongense TaxID=2682845 RepID=A0ABW9ULD6_9BACL|nr:MULTISPECIES: hypothetical protein [Paenibacillus]MBA2939878.1 hypothetical protein [Paenibacillus sp. CGMCC 1.16610]MVQ39538.1 hypothetical protein [Paenibacillus anseongense]